MERKWVHVMFAVAGIVLAWLLAKCGEWAWSYFGKPNELARRPAAPSPSPASRRCVALAERRAVRARQRGHGRAAQGHLADPQGDRAARRIVVIVTTIVASLLPRRVRRRVVLGHAHDLRIVKQQWIAVIYWRAAQRQSVHGDEVVRGPHLLGPREQGAPVAAGAGQADGQGGAVRPDPHPDRVGAGDGQGPAPHHHAQVLPGLHVRPDGAQRGDLPPRQEHAQDHRLPRRHQPDAGAGEGDRRDQHRR